MDAIKTRYDSGLVLLSPAGGAGRREYDCVFVRPGRVLRMDGQESDWLIPANVIEAAAPLFGGVSCYLNHPEIVLFGRQEPQLEKLIGVTFNVRWSAEDRALLGGIRLYDNGSSSMAVLAESLFDQMIADREAGLEVPPVGLSAAFFHRGSLDEESGLYVTHEFVKVLSVDVVYSAGAGGYVRSALAAMGPEAARYFSGAWPQGGSELGKKEDVDPVAAPVEAAPVAGAGSPGDVLAAIQGLGEQLEELAARLSPPPPVAPVAAPGPAEDALGRQVAELSAAVARLTADKAAAVEPAVVQGMGQAPRGSWVMVGPGSVEQVEMAVLALIEGKRPPAGVAPLTGIRELYHLLSGDFEMTGLFHGDRVYLANVNCGTMAGLVANALNKVVVNQFQQYPRWWEPAVTPEDFTSLQDARWITLGGVGELPTVPEGGAYTELTWDDQTETDAFVKKGGYLGITLETIDKDDTRKVVAAPRALAQAAWLTLGKAIAAIFTANSGTGPTMSDGTVLFHANHGNVGATALSPAAFEAVKVAMMKQTEVNSGERLGALTYPRLLWAPIDLETLALQILATEQVPGSTEYNINPLAEGEGREERLASARRRVITCPLWTDTNNWAAQADPLMYPSVGLGFRYGRTPEIFSVASPTAGLMFSNDTMPVKVRFFFAVGPTDWRGLYKSNVT